LHIGWQQKFKAAEFPGSAGLVSAIFSSAFRLAVEAQLRRSMPHLYTLDLRTDNQCKLQIKRKTMPRLPSGKVAREQAFCTREHL